MRNPYIRELSGVAKPVRKALLASIGFTDGTGKQRLLRLVASQEHADNSPNYYYDMDTWHQRTFKTDMWNAPVLLFRTTRVYDHGSEYATVEIPTHCSRIHHSGDSRMRYLCRKTICV